MKKIIPKSSKKFSNILINYNIFTVEQFEGALSPDLPFFDKKNIVSKGLVTNYKSIQKNNQKDSVKIRKIRKLFKTSQKEASIIYGSLKQIEFPNRVMKSNPSVLSLGLQISKVRHKSFYWTNDYKVNEFEGSRYVIPDYEKMGSVFDQGKRGTCVSNAATSLVDYITECQTSRQFLYHQCKMIDGCSNMSGTYMHTPIRISCDKELIDYGTIDEKQWPYISYNTDIEHQGPPPEKCFNTKRYFSNEPVFIRNSSIIIDIKELLLGSNIVSAVPVTMGFTLFESFNSYNTSTTGWVTMPLPEEKPIGGHAMLIVGWDDVDQVFIVRNSWGYSWGAENKYGKPGHALILYKYFLKHTHGGCSLLSIGEAVFEVKEQYRLYNNMVKSSQSGLRKVAVSKRKIPKRSQRKFNFISIIRTLILLVVLCGGLRLLFPGTFFLLRYYVVEIYLRVYSYIMELILIF